MNNIIFKSVDDKAHEMSALYTGQDKSFDEMLTVRPNDPIVSYYLSKDGLIVRAVKAPHLNADLPTAPVLLQFFDHSGNCTARLNKGFESRAAFALLVGEDVRRDTFYELSDRPSFVKLPDLSQAGRSFLPFLPALARNRSIESFDF